MTPTEYWKQRCLAAEKYAYYLIDNAESYDPKKLIALGELYYDWHEIKNTPEPELELPDTKNNLKE